jgi:hypothetical protein
VACAWHLVDYKSIPPFDLPRGRLAVFDLPSDNPANTMQLFKYVSDEIPLVKVVRLSRNDNFENRLK